MGENVLIACHECSRNFNIPLDEARQYNKNNHYICSACKNKENTPTLRLEESNTLNSENADIKTNQIGGNGNTGQTTPILPSEHIINPIHQFADPDVNAEIERTRAPRRNARNGIYNVSDYVGGIPRTLNDYEHIASDRVRRELDEIRGRREQAERAYQAEQTRVANQRNEGGGFNFFGLVPILIIIPIMLIIGTQIFSNVSSAVDCTMINNTSFKDQCTQIKGQMNVAILIIPIVLIAVIILVVRMIL